MDGWMDPLISLLQLPSGSVLSKLFYISVITPVVTSLLLKTKFHSHCQILLLAPAHLFAICCLPSCFSALRLPVALLSFCFLCACFSFSPHQHFYGEFVSLRKLHPPIYPAYFCSAFGFSASSTCDNQKKIYP